MKTLSGLRGVLHWGIKYALSETRQRKEGLTLSIRPLEQTVKFVCSSLNVTNPKNPKAFKNASTAK